MSEHPGVVLITGGCGFIGSNFINYIFGKWPTTRYFDLLFSPCNTEIPGNLLSFVLALLHTVWHCSVKPGPSTSVWFGTEDNFGCLEAWRD